MEITDKTPQLILAFDPTYRLSAIFRSIKEAATITGSLRQSLMKAIHGDIITVNDHYWRVVPDDWQIDPDDIDVLTLFEFDKAMKVDRKIYRTRHMRRGEVILESKHPKYNKL